MPTHASTFLTLLALVAALGSGCAHSSNRPTACLASSSAETTPEPSPALAASPADLAASSPECSEEPCPQVALTFYPPSGDLIASELNRVYFVARTADGKPIEVAGAIEDDSQASVATFRTDALGRGDLAIPPEAGQQYRLRIDSPERTTTSSQVPRALAWRPQKPLPAVSAPGHRLRWIRTSAASPSAWSCRSWCWPWPSPSSPSWAGSERPTARSRRDWPAPRCPRRSRSSGSDHGRPSSLSSAWTCAATSSASRRWCLRSFKATMLPPAIAELAGACAAGGGS